MIAWDADRTGLGWYRMGCDQIGQAQDGRDRRGLACWNRSGSQGLGWDRSGLARDMTREGWHGMGWDSLARDVEVARLLTPIQGLNMTGLTVLGYNVKIHFAPEPSFTL